MATLLFTGYVPPTQVEVEDTLRSWFSSPTVSLGYPTPVLSLAFPAGPSGKPWKVFIMWTFKL